MGTWPSPRVGGLAGIIVLVLTGALLGMASLRDPGYVRLSVASGAAASGSRTFLVQAAPFSQVELAVNGRRLTSAYVPGNAREIRFEQTPLELGRNTVLARATLWYATVRRVHEASVVVHNAPSRRSAQGDAAEAVSRTNALRGDRTLTLDVHYQEAAAAFAVRIARSDPAAAAIVNGRVDAPAFVDEVFGRPELNHAPLARFFSGVRPHFEVNGDRITISASSGMRRPGLEQLPPFAGTLEIANDLTAPRVRVTGTATPVSTSRDARRWVHDVLRLTVADYRVDDLLPAPARRDGEAYLWEHPFAQGQRAVTVPLTYTPLASLSSLRRGLSMSVFAFAHPVLARFLAFGHGFLIAIPMFAYLVLAKRRDTRLALIARRLIAVAVAADVFNACISSQPDVNLEIPLIAPALRGLTATLLTQLVVPVVIGAALAVIAASVARLVRRFTSTPGVLVYEAAGAVRTAAAAYAAVAVLGYAAGAFARVPMLSNGVIDVLLAGSLLGFVGALGWWSLPRPGQAVAFTTVSVAGALVLAFPFSLAHYGTWAQTAALAATGFANPVSPASLATEFVRILGAAAPFAFGAVLLLRALRPNAATAGIGPESFARLAFCCYAVAPGGVVLLVPISFMLAWWTFGRLRVAVRPDPLPTVAPTAADRRTLLWVALVFAALDAVLIAWLAGPHVAELHTPFIALEAAGYLGAAAVSFTLPALAFGTWCARQGGGSALRRARITAFWVVGCSLPAWFLRFDDGASFVATIALTVIFYLALGASFGAPAARSDEAAARVS